MSQEPIYVFGAFQLDVRRESLTRDAEPVALPPRHFGILRLLVSRAGEVVSKDALIEAGWDDVAVTDNSLEQAMSNLRRRLGSSPDGPPYIETLARRGYRFRSVVTTIAPRETDDVLARLLQPHRVFVEGRAALETLEGEAVERARTAFAELLERDANYAAGHIGLANALALEFEGTRMSGRPDVALLSRAIHHAREACRLDSESGEPWATLAFVLSRASSGSDAVAAGRRAITLEPENWRHHVRLAYAGWGEERLRAARHALKRLPGLGLAHWLAATVHVARQAFDEAERELRTGTAAQGQQADRGRFGSVGLHLLLGLLHLARGDRAAAEDELSRELAFESGGHIYSAQACANAWCAVGGMRLQEARRDEALAAFDQALKRVEGHAAALAGVTVAATGSRRTSSRTLLQRRLAALEGHGAVLEAAMVRGIPDVCAGRHAEAARRVAHALESASTPAGAGWTIPVDPLLQVTSHPAEWAVVLAALRGRAA